MSTVATRSYQDIRQALLAHEELALIDVREEDPFAQEHPLFTANIPLSKLELEIFARVPLRDTRITVYDDGEGLAHQAAERLVALGYSDVALLEGGLAGWRAAGGELFRDVNVPSKAFGELVESQRHTPSLGAEEVLALINSQADVVVLDANNRRLVAQGLKRIRAGAMPAGMAALFNVAGRKAAMATTFDFGFALGPRINAAGRLADMTIGIECLLTDDPSHADALARTLDGINRERRDIEGGMRDQALLLAENLFTDDAEPPPAISVFDAEFHQGVVGIVASRIKDKLHRPTFVFAPSSAPGQGDKLKGSGRSIAGFHLRDAIDLVSKRHPGVLLQFGGHAMAAGCTIAANQFEVFEQALAQIASEWLDASTLTRRIATDGPLAPQYCRADVVDTLHREVWGQGFAPPTFSEEVQVLSQRLVGADKNHLSLKLLHHGQPVDGVWFGRSEPLPSKVLLAFRLDINEWKGERKVQFLIDGAQL